MLVLVLNQFKFYWRNVAAYLGIFPGQAYHKTYKTHLGNNNDFLFDIVLVFII